MSLRLRLLLILAPLFVAGLVASGAVTYSALQSFLLARVDQQLISGHPAVEEALNSTAFGAQGQVAGVGPTSLPAGTYGELTAADGTVVATVRLTFGGPGSAEGRSDSVARPNLPSPLPALGGNGNTLLTVSGSGGVGHYRVYIDNAEAGNGDLLVVAVPLDDVESTLGQLLLLEALVGVAITALIVVATWLLVRRGLSPLERIAATARSIASEDLSRRVSPAADRTEVGRLGLALNEMLAKLEAAFAEICRNEERMRHFLSDASHELRTPLTSMRGYAELIRRNPDMTNEDTALALRRMEEETTRMGLLVEDLLMLARLDQGRPLEQNAVDLAMLVSDACADARVADPGRTITAEIADITVRGDEMRLRQAVGNLMRNALVHTPAGMPVEAVLRTEDSTAVIEIVDHGPGIPEGHADKIFRRFHRADPGRSGDQGGSGLGLSIAWAIVDAHGGELSVRATEGGGATFRIALPLDPS